MKDDYLELDTEKTFKKGLKLSSMDSLEIIDLFIDDQEIILKSLKKNKKKLISASEIFYKTYKNNSRIFFIGAGTSGRLGVIEAAELPPTFGTNKNSIIGIIAGGNKALVTAIEGAEDNKLLGIKNLKKNKIKQGDLIIGISASGRTEYVLSALKYYKKRGINTVLITTNKLSSKVSDLDLSFLIGPELISGSTRLKSGTVTKVALNIITTMAMIKANKVLNGLMIDIKPTTNKLRARCIRNTAIILNLTLNMSEKLLIKSKWNIRVAIIMNNKNMSYRDALKTSKTLPIGEII